MTKIIKHKNSVDLACHQYSVSTSLYRSSIMTTISKAGRQALIDYKYQSTLKGWLDSNVMNDFWERVVLFCPLSIAPNVITFTGTIQYTISSLIFASYCTDLEKSVEPWVYYMLAASLFIYQTLDAIDGKHARRTKQSSPLGQLFDHGNDALIVTPLLTTTFATAKYGTTWAFVMILMSAYSVFFMINWRARHEGMMHFGVFSVTEGQLMAVGVGIVTGMFGNDIWRVQVFGVDCRHLITGVLLVIVMYYVYDSYRAVQKYYKETNKEDPGQVYELLHMVLFLIGFMCWNVCDVLRDYPWTYVWIAGLVFCGIIHRLIVADVTHMKTTKYYSLLNPLWIMIFGSLYEFVLGVKKAQSVMNSPYMVYGILVYVLVFWMAYVLKVIDEICETLDIRLFVINPPKIKKGQ
eukprot:35462_1